ncbi:MAG: tail fiber domain-containing protein, partial [Aurantibacter sp.]
IGRFNIAGGNSGSWVNTDPLFEIGIGSGPGSRANAMTVLKNGNVGIGDETPTAKLEVDGNIRSSDLAGVGERNVVADASGNLIIGAGGGGSSLWSENGSDIYFNGGNVGIGTINPGAPLEVNTSLGRVFLIKSTSSNSYMQYATPAGSVGYSGVWAGDNDIDFGTTSANNTGKVHLTTKATPKLTVAANGNVGIGTTGPTTKLHIKSNSTVAKPHIKIEEEGNDYARIEFTNNTSNALWHIAGLADNTPANSKINFYFRNNNGAANRMTITGDGNVLVDGSLVHSSDLRLKKDMEELPYGLKEVLQLEPKIYRWVDNRNAGSRSLGLIAQAVQPIIPEIVHEEDDSEKTLSLSYTELIPVIVSAIKEQHQIIGDQSKRISDLEERMKKLEAKINN